MARTAKPKARVTLDMKGAALLVSRGTVGVGTPVRAGETTFYITRLSRNAEFTVYHNRMMPAVLASLALLIMGVIAKFAFPRSEASPAT